MEANSFAFAEKDSKNVLVPKNVSIYLDFGTLYLDIIIKYPETHF